MVTIQCDGKSKKNNFFVFVWKCLVFSQKSWRALSNWKKLKFNYVLIVE